MKHLVILAAAAASLAGASALPATAASTNTARASGSPTVYARPSLNARAVGRLAKGERVHLEFCSVDYVWCQVVGRTNGADGWVIGADLVGMGAKVEVTPYHFDFNPLNPIPDHFRSGRPNNNGGGDHHPRPPKGN